MKLEDNLTKGKLEQARAAANLARLEVLDRWVPQQWGDEPCKFYEHLQGNTTGTDAALQAAALAFRYQGPKRNRAIMNALVLVADMAEKVPQKVAVPTAQKMAELYQENKVCGVEHGYPYKAETNLKDLCEIAASKAALVALDITPEEMREAAQKARIKAGPVFTP